jgi:hypothetical protein
MPAVVLNACMLASGNEKLGRLIAQHGYLSDLAQLSVAPTMFLDIRT